jgi:hypothetical protein
MKNTSPNSLYTTNNTITNNRQGEDGDYTSNQDNEMDEEENNKIQWEEQSTIAKLINISTTILLAHDNLILGVSENHPRYYVDLHTIFSDIN